LASAEGRGWRKGEQEIRGTGYQNSRVSGGQEIRVSEYQENKECNRRDI